MDDRYLFFALADRDFFDVPWSGTTEPQLGPQPELTAGFRQQVHGPWRQFDADGVSVPEAGWKIHVSSRPHDVDRAIEAVARVCARERVSWKVLRTRRLVRSSQHKYAPISLAGKVCVLYPASVEQLESCVEQLAVALVGVSGPHIHGDHHHGEVPLGLRWGAFREYWLEAADGRAVPGARTADGAVPDDRLGPPRPLPPTIDTLLRRRPVVAELPVTAARTVHRCHGGSLYEARLRDGRTVALKEARHHAGLDSDGVDAVERLRHEYEVLQRLSGHAVAPEPLDYWEADDSDLLVMEWIDGEALSARISRDHPAGRPDLVSNGAQFHEWAATFGDRLRALVDEVHGLGVTHGDLHPGNVVVLPDGARLVDFEGAAIDGVAVTTAIGTPGFHLDDPDPVARDRYAIERTVASVTEPDVTLLERRPDLAVTFGCPSAHTDVDAPGSTHALIEWLVDGMLRRATPERRDRLFPGGIEQFTTPLGGHNLLSGAAGVLLALQAVGVEASAAHLDWLSAVPGSRPCRGLAEGVDGVALALALMGRPERAAELIERVDRLPVGLSWTRGRAGCAVTLTELGLALDDDDLVARGLEASAQVSAAAVDGTAVVAGPGLLEGWAGIALALLRIGELVPSVEADLRVGATAALRRERELLHLVDGKLFARPGGRLRVGIGHGSAAFALGAAALAEEGAFEADAAAAAAACREARLPVVGLMDGLAGTALTMRVHGDQAAAERLEERAGWHGVPTASGWSTLGASRIRCSDDVMTGSAGVLVSLGECGPGRLSHVLRLPIRPLNALDDSCHIASLSLGTAADSPTAVG